MDSDFNSDSEISPNKATANTDPAFQDQLASAIAGLAGTAGLTETPSERRPTDLDGLPVPISDQFWRLDPRNIKVERISGLIFSSVLLACVFIGLIVLWFAVDFGWIWFTTAGVSSAITIVAFWFSIFWPAKSYERSSWRLDREGLEIRRGVLFRHRITIPLGRVQHADVSQGPLQRQFDVGTLTVHTAGTQHASIPLEGLAHSTAIELRDLIVQQKKGQNVV